MPERKYATTGVLFVVTLLVCLATVAVSSRRPISGRGGQGTQLPINNRTRSLEVLSVSTADGFLQLSLKNSGSKNITWFKLLIGGTGLEAEFTYASDPVLAPGEVYNEFFRADSDVSVKGVTVLSVVFEDGTSEGEELPVKQIKERRRGEKAQLQRILTLLESAINSSAAGGDPPLENLEAELTNLPDGAGDHVPEGVRIGQANTRSQVISFVQELRRRRGKQGRTTNREALTELKIKYQHIVARL